jgi:hypothetical protein
MKPSKKERLEQMRPLYDQWVARVESDIAAHVTSKRDRIQIDAVSIRQHGMPADDELPRALELAMVRLCEESVADIGLSWRDGGEADFGALFRERVQNELEPIWEERRRKADTWHMGFWKVSDRRLTTAYVALEATHVAWNTELSHKERSVNTAALVDELVGVMQSRFGEMSTRWKEAEQVFRKPALSLYKKILDKAEAAVESETDALAAELDMMISRDLVDALTERRKVFLEQQGIQELITFYSMSLESLPKEIWHKESDSGSEPIPREPFELHHEVDSVFQNGLFRLLRQVSEEMNQQFERLLKKATDIREIVEVNLNAGKHAEAADRDTIIQEGLERAAQRIQELTENYRVRLAKVLENAQADITTYTDLLSECAKLERYDAIHSLNSDLKRRRQATSAKHSIIAGWSRFVDAALVRYRFSMIKVNEVVNPIRAFLGYRIDELDVPVARTRASDYLNETDVRLNELPLIYRTLFSFQPVTDARYLKGRERMMTSIADSRSRWEKKQFSNVVLIGEQGSGKTSLLDALTSTTMKDQPIRRFMVTSTIWTEADLTDLLKTEFDCKDAETMDDVVAHVLASPRQIVILEGLHNLFLRHMNGFEAMERFMLFLTQTGQSVFWVITCTRYSWNYLDDVMQLSGNFTHVMSTDRMSASDIREAIMTRHRVSGYQAVFTPSDSVKRSRAYKKLIDNEEARQAFLEAEYFDDLTKWSHGNITIAMLFWLRSIRDVNVDTFTITPFSKDLTEIGDTFLLDDLFALASILQHENINVSELALNQNRSEADCRLTLTRLHVRRMLIEKNGRYFLNTVLLRPMTIVLQSKNILH